MSLYVHKSMFTRKMDVSGILTNGLKHIDSMLVDDKTQNAHTKYLLSSK